MEQFHVISLVGADTRIVTPASDLAQATRDLNRKTLALHARHALSWLLRGSAVAAIFLLGRFAVEGAIGGALTWTAGFMSVYITWESRATGKQSCTGFATMRATGSSARTTRSSRRCRSRNPFSPSEGT